MTNKISVVIPMYNSEKTIRNSLQSIIHQTLPPDEIIVINDGSKDDSAKIVEEIITQNAHTNISIILLNQENKGVSEARNNGIKRARNLWIALQDADDEWHPDKLKIMDQVINKKNVLYAHSFTVNKFSDQQHLTHLSTKEISLMDVIIKNQFVTPSVILNKEEGLLFDETMRYTEDHDLWIRMLQNGKKALFVKLDLVRLGREQLSEGGASANLWKMRKGEIKVYRKFVTSRKRYILLYPFLICFSLMKFVKTLLFKK